VYSDTSAEFEKVWNDKNARHDLIPGKPMLAEIRDFFRSEYGINLTTVLLAEKLAFARKQYVERLLLGVL
jgi:hypothetical protein